MTLLLVSPAEPQRVRDQLSRRLPDTPVQLHPRPEQLGVDFCWRERGQWWGVQRKELTDLLASIQDGRLAKEIGQMQCAVTNPLLVIERPPTWTADGMLLDDQWRQQFTYQMWVGLIASLGQAGVQVMQTQTISQTVDAIGAMMQWSRKPTHTLGSNRPGPTGSEWGKATSREWAVHFLQGLSGIGPETASAVFDTFGRVPLRWDVTEDELLAIRGIGPKRAKQMMGALV
jgi:ERCC4-type nuclease